MSEIQRWTVSQMNDHGWQHTGHDKGEWVTYADHVAAVAAAEQRVRDELAASVLDGTAVLYGERIWSAADHVAAVDGVKP